MTSGQAAGKNRRLLVSAVLPAVLLIGLVLASGGNPFGGGDNGPPTAAPSVNATPAAIATTTSPVTGVVKGSVTVSVHKVKADTYVFTYTVHDTGSTPIAGFQLNGQSANLFALGGPAAWSRFGSGVCGGKYPGVLIYWSTNSASHSVMQAGSRATFRYKVRTTGETAATYSLSYGNARPQFGIVRIPAPSTRPVPGVCSR